MSYQTITLLMLWIAAPAATATPILYALGAPWWRSLYGKAFLASATTLALLVDLTLAFYAWDGHMGAKKTISLIVYALVVLSAWLGMTLVLREQWLRRRP